MTPSCPSTVACGPDHLKYDERAAASLCQRPRSKGRVEEVPGQECPGHRQQGKSLCTSGADTPVRASLWYTAGLSTSPEDRGHAYGPPPTTSPAALQLPQPKNSGVPRWQRVEDVVNRGHHGRPNHGLQSKASPPAPARRRRKPHTTCDAPV